MKLYDLKRNSLMRIVDIKETKRDATFHHIDGSYSYCTFDDEVLTPGKPREPFHLAAWTNMILISGKWEIDEECSDNDTPL